MLIVNSSPASSAIEVSASKERVSESLSKSKQSAQLTSITSKVTAAFSAPEFATVIVVFPASAIVAT